MVWLACHFPARDACANGVSYTLGYLRDPKFLVLKGYWSLTSGMKMINNNNKKNMSVLDDKLCYSTSRWQKVRVSRVVV